MGGAGHHPRRLLPAAVRALGPRPQRAAPGGADRLPDPALLLLLHRDLAAGSLLPHRPAHPGGHGAVPDERGRRPHLVRLSLPADGVDRPVPRHRALRRRRPPRAHAARPQALVGGDLGAQGRQAFPLADGGVVDRRRLGALFRRRADAGEGSRHRPGAARRLRLHRHSHLHDLRARRPHARAGLPLYVPVAAHPGRAHRRIRAQRHLPLRPRRAALLGQEGRAIARRRPAGRRLRRLPAMRARLPDRRRHPRRRQSRLHPVRPVHRRLRQRHGQARPPHRADRLRHRHEHQAAPGGPGADRPAVPHRARCFTPPSSRSSAAS